MAIEIAYRMNVLLLQLTRVMYRTDRRPSSRYTVHTRRMLKSRAYLRSLMRPCHDPKIRRNRHSSQM